MNQRIELEKNLPLSPLLIEIIDAQTEFGPFGPKERFLLEYSQLVAQLRLVYIQKKGDFGPIWEAIKRKGEVGKKLGFLEKDLDFLNVYIRDQFREEWQLHEFIKKVSQRLEEGEKS